MLHKSQSIFILPIISIVILIISSLVIIEMKLDNSRNKIDETAS